MIGEEATIVTGGRSEAAEAVIADVARHAGLARPATDAATALVAAFLVTTLSSRRVAELRDHIPEIDELAAEGEALARDLAAGPAEAARPTLTGRLLGALDGMVGDDGGPLSRTVHLVGQLGRLGFGTGDMRDLGRGMEAHVRVRLGDARVDDLIGRAKSKVPILGRFL